MHLFITQVAQVEAMMSSVERIKHYSENVDVEEELMIADAATASSRNRVPVVVPQVLNIHAFFHTLCILIG